MKKRLFLLILTLVGMCPAVYCADHEGEEIFESNILLPLGGEVIDDDDQHNKLRDTSQLV